MEHALNIEKYKKLHSAGNARRMPYRLMFQSKIIHSQKGDELKTSVGFCFLVRLEPLSSHNSLYPHPKDRPTK